MASHTLSVDEIIKIIGPAARTKAGTPMRSRQDRLIGDFVITMNTFARAYNLDRLVNLAAFIGQVAVESDYFRTAMEYASGKAYESRTDLGNTKAIDGDGPKYKGHGLIQTTGHENHAKVTTWIRKTFASVISGPIPSFIDEPEKLSLSPYHTLSAIYFWHVGNRTGKSLNRYALEGNFEMITRIINGGLTHHDRRLNMMANAALVFLGYDTDKAGIIAFQKKAKLTADGLIGDKTRKALNDALIEADVAADAIKEMSKPAIVVTTPMVTIPPVVSTQVVPVKPAYEAAPEVKPKRGGGLLNGLLNWLGY